MMRRWSLSALALGIFVVWMGCSRAAVAADMRDALSWLDTLGFPDAKNLPYVRVATGSSIRWGPAASEPVR